MPVNQPPINEDIVESSWQYEVTALINELEQAIRLLQQQVDDLEERVATLEGG